MRTKTPELKSWNCTLPYKTWALLKMMAIKENTNMKDIVVEFVEKQRKKYETV